MTLFWHPTGPLLRYEAGLLHVEDLNPHVQTKWRMSRWAMAKLAWCCLLAALRRYS
jgi:hypothetical protein